MPWAARDAAQGSRIQIVTPQERSGRSMIPHSDCNSARAVRSRKALRDRFIATMECRSRYFYPLLQGSAGILAAKEKQRTTHHRVDSIPSGKKWKRFRWSPPSHGWGSFFLSFFLCIYVFIYLFVCLLFCSFIYLFVYLFVYIITYLLIYIYLFIYFFTYIFTYLFTFLLMYLLIYLLINYLIIN